MWRIAAVCCRSVVHADGDCVVNAITHSAAYAITNASTQVGVT